ncbi:hypothetical protein SDC9_159697 [bioreactor metagenome]|uniref:Uncharacterized protein n=1 Tax=bioreactor metagenome TaxID=1076179 RepID=A0A645FGA2_9ZZZZ
MEIIKFICDMIFSILVIITVYARLFNKDNKNGYIYKIIITLVYNYVIVFILAHIYFFKEKLPLDATYISFELRSIIFIVVFIIIIIKDLKNSYKKN